MCPDGPRSSPRISARITDRRGRSAAHRGTRPLPHEWTASQKGGQKSNMRDSPPRVLIGTRPTCGSGVVPRWGAQRPQDFSSHHKSPGPQRGPSRYKTAPTRMDCRQEVGQKYNLRGSPPRALMDTRQPVGALVPRWGAQRPQDFSSHHKSPGPQRGPSRYKTAPTRARGGFSTQLGSMNCRGRYIASPAPRRATKTINCAPAHSPDHETLRDWTRSAP